MKTKIKNLIVNNCYIRKYLQTVKKIIYKYSRGCNNKIDKIIFILKGIFKIKIIKLDKEENKGKQIRKMLNNIAIDINTDTGFIHFWDPYIVMCAREISFENISIDYSKVLDLSLNDYKKQYFNSEKNEFNLNQMELLLGIEELINRVIVEIKKSDNKDKKNFEQYFENMKNCKASSFEEALQRILFYNQLLWQTDHRLNGFGRLDIVLSRVYANEKNKDDERIINLIMNFLKTAHKYYEYKSNVLLGDTGQIIILGGNKIDGSYQCNKLTYLFIEAVKRLQKPDPKILLRISERTPRKLIEEATQCIATGIGSPLFSNDDVIIPKLIKFGVNEIDAYNYVTSACWEPLVVGKSLDQNNLKSINFLEPLNRVLETEDLIKTNNFDALMKYYFKHLEKYIKEIMEQLDIIKWEKDPLLSLFTDNCYKYSKDISIGGAIYNNYGVTGVAMANTVNSIINIKNIAFINKEKTLIELNEDRKNNFKDEKLLEKIKSNKVQFGNDENEVIDIVNIITEKTNKIFKEYTNKFGGKLKFGLSAPSYITASANFPASLDGRKNNEPFNVHISATNSPYTELIQFASKLKYTENGINGNVIDFMVAPDFINNNFNKFVDFIILSTKLGFYQMQMNVVSSKILIRAKNHPEEFPNLIVRVWGFSAYFNELPENYKELLIKRALQNEAN